MFYPEMGQNISILILTKIIQYVTYFCKQKKNVCEETSEDGIRISASIPLAYVS